MVKEFLIALTNKTDGYKKDDVVGIRVSGSNYAVYEKVNSFAVVCIELDSTLMVKTETENVDENSPEYPEPITIYSYDEFKFLQSVDNVVDGELISTDYVFKYKCKKIFSSEELALWESNIEADFDTALASSRANPILSSELEKK